MYNLQCDCGLYENYHEGALVMISRTLHASLQACAQQFPVVAIMGPRQSGKTTLARQTFPDYYYVSLEDLDRRAAAEHDPRGFLTSCAQYTGVIIDEIQEVPALFSYLQGIVDQAYKPGFFIITGSQHFLMHEKITQTLAGRIALLTLLPLSITELKQANLLPDLDQLLIKGCYPRLYSQPITVQTWYNNYISTYVEKDVRQILRVSDVIAFQRFLKLCAARVGNIVNYADLARDADVSPNTAKAWLSILEASFIIKLVAPYYKNFNKRVIKSPKLYFYDTSLVCNLLGIRSVEDISIHPLRRALFETLIMSEFFKHAFNRNEAPNIYFWRDVQGHEIDIVVEQSFNNVLPIEVKAGMTVNNDFFKGLRDWQKITENQAPMYVVFGGNDNLVYKNNQVVSWKSMEQLLVR